MTDPIRSSAEYILGRLRRGFTGLTEYRQVDEAEFPNINFEPYRLTGRLLEADGFTHLVDLEDLRASADPDPQFQRTVTRWWASPDRGTVAGHYQTDLWSSRSCEDWSGVSRIFAGWRRRGARCPISCLATTSA